MIFGLWALKLIFLVVTRAVSVLGLSRREAWWKDAEILMLRHQLAVALRERPRVHSRLTWPDRAWLALLAGTVPTERLAAARASRARTRIAAAPWDCWTPAAALVHHSSACPMSVSRCRFAGRCHLVRVGTRRPVRHCSLAW